MKQTTVHFEELGYFLPAECEAIKKELEGYSYMNFKIGWSNYCGNCTLTVITTYETTPEELKTFFLHCALGKIFDLKRQIKAK
jgi:hypothetical protein